MRDLNSVASLLGAPAQHHPLWWLVLAIVVFAFVMPLAWLLSRDPTGQQH